MKLSPQIFLLAMGIIVCIVLVIVGVIFISPQMGTIGSGIQLKNQVTTKNKTITNVTSLDIDIPGNVTIETAQESSVAITADDAILECIDITDANRKLIINYAVKCQEKSKSEYSFPSDATITIVIKTPFIDRVSVNGNANVNASLKDSKIVTLVVSKTGAITAEVASNELIGRISGSGTITVKGTAFSQTVEITGSGTFNGKEVSGNVGEVLVSSSGKTIINVSEVLKVKGTGSGDVLYSGSPSLTITKSGSSKVTKTE